MKNSLLIAFLFGSFFSFSQVLNNEQGSTYAVVVGISDYQDEDIPDLKYADRDAEAFVQWLQSSAGGSVSESNIQLLLNEKATLGQFGAALSWLLEQSKEGDQAIIYFSGHGDVDSKIFGQEGFLLLWDTSSKSYLIGGTFQLELLKKIVTSLSAINKSKVILITDACRSGKLAGSTIGGAQITNYNLSQRFSGEIKILSCQPDEYSVESEQWGGGRGAFSYHLVDGLYGLADREGDGTISLSDIDRYLEDHVTKEVFPIEQTPMIIGDKKESLAYVFPDLLADQQKSKQGLLPQFKAFEQRGIEEEILVVVDTTIEKLYNYFLKSLEEKKFFEPKEACADAYYEQLITELSIEPLHSTMRRNYAAALQDDAQQAVNGMMENDLDEYNMAEGRTEKYKTFSRQLERAAELLGEQHYFYPSLMAQKWFFEGYLIYIESAEFPDEENGRKVLKHFWKSLKWQPNFPLACEMIGYLYQTNISRPDSAEYYSRKSMQLAPRWAIPYASIAELLLKKGQINEALAVLDTAIMLDSNAVMFWLYKGRYYIIQKRFEEAEQIYLHAISLDSNQAYIYQNLGSLYSNIGEYEKAEQQLLKAIEKDSILSNADIQKATNIASLGGIYRKMGRYSESEELLERALQYSDKILFLWIELSGVYLQLNNLQKAEPAIKRTLELIPSTQLSLKNSGTLYLRKGETEKARTIFEDLIDRYPRGFYGYLGMAGLYAQEGDLQLSLEFTEKAFQTIEKAYPRNNFWVTIKDDYDLKPLRGMQEFETLVGKYAPEKPND